MLINSTHEQHNLKKYFIQPEIVKPNWNLGTDIQKQ